MSWNVGVLDGNVALVTLEHLLWWRRFDSEHSVGRQRRVDRGHVVLHRQDVFASKVTRDEAMAVIALLVLPLNDYCVIRCLDGDLVRLEVMHIHAGLEAILAKVQVLCIGHLFRLSRQRPVD